METYIITGIWSDSDMTDFDFDNPGAADDFAEKALAAVGGKMLHSWPTLGRFDFFAVVEVPDANAVRAFVACLPKNIRTETLRAFANQDSAFFDNAKKIMAAMSH